MGCFIQLLACTSVGNERDNHFSIRTILVLPTFNPVIQTPHPPVRCMYAQPPVRSVYVQTAASCTQCVRTDGSPFTLRIRIVCGCLKCTEIRTRIVVRWVYVIIDTIPHSLRTYTWLVSHQKRLFKTHKRLVYVSYEFSKPFGRFAFQQIELDIPKHWRN